MFWFWLSFDVTHFMLFYIFLKIIKSKTHNKKINCPTCRHIFSRD